MKIKSKNMFLSFLSILVAMGMLASTSLADTPYWDVTWNFRKQIAITNNVSTTLYDYSMMVTLDTVGLISQGKMQSDCGDIRIIENGVEINYGIKNPNSASTEIYFIANDLIVGINNDIHVYYGNPDADNGFVGNWKDAFYIWYDDFDTDRGWDNCPGNERPGSVTVDTVNGWLYASYGSYMDYLVCPTDGSSFPMNGRVGFKAETRIMAENDNWCQIMVSLTNSSHTASVPIIDFRVGHNDYYFLWDTPFVSKTLDDDVWYEATAVYNRLTGVWYGEFANDGIRSGIRTPQEDDDFSTIMFDICNGINMYLDYLYLRYFIEPEPSYSLGIEESGVEVPPSETIEEILDFIEDSNDDGTLAGVGRGKSGQSGLDPLIKKLQNAESLIEDELFEDAWIQLFDAYKCTDGQSPPPDLVTGEATSELADRIMNAMEDLLPAYEMVIDYPNAIVFSFSGEIDDGRSPHVLAKIAIGAAPNVLLWLGGFTGGWSAVIGILGEFLVALDSTDPISVLPSAPNVEVQNGIYVAENVTDDTEYSAIVFLDFIGAGWGGWTLDDVDELKLKSRHGNGGYIHDELTVLSSDQMRELETSKNYAVFPKVFFSVSDLPEDEDAPWLEASFRKGPPITTYEDGTGLHLNRD